MDKILNGTGKRAMICIIIIGQKEVFGVLRNPFRDIDAKHMRRSSDLLKKQNDYAK